jgi:nitroreductase
MMIQTTEIHTEHGVKEYDNVHELIAGRWSPRAFSDRPISPEDMQTLFESASLAPSSMNEQPWRFVYAHRGEPLFRDFVACLNPNNAVWAEKAAVLLLSYASLIHERNQRPNRFALHDTGSANTLLLLQAYAMDIYGHMMGGFDREKTITTLGLSDTLEPVCFIALGYLGEADALDPALMEREVLPRRRRSVESFAFHGKISSAGLH